MTHTTNGMAGRSHNGRRLDSNLGNKSASFKTESLTAFTLAAGAIGLGISMMESEKAAAAEKAEASENAADSAAGHTPIDGTHQIADDGVGLSYGDHGAVPSAVTQVTSSHEIAAAQEIGHEPASPVENSPPQAETANDTQAEAAHIENLAAEVSQDAGQQIADASNSNSPATGSQSAEAGHPVGSGGHVVEVSTGNPLPEVGGVHIPLPVTTIETSDHTPVGATDGLGDTLHGVTDALDGVVSGVTDGLGDTLGGVTDALDGVVAGVTDGLGDTLGGVTGAVSGIINGASNTLDGVTTLLGAVFGGANGSSGGSSMDAATIELTSSIQDGGTSADSTGLSQTDLFDAAHGALGNVDGILSSLVPDLTFIGQSLVSAGEHHDLSNSHGSLLNGFL